MRGDSSTPILGQTDLTGGRTRLLSLRASKSMDSWNGVRFGEHHEYNLSHPFIKLAVTSNVTTGGILCGKDQLWNRVPLILKLAQQWWADKKQEDREAQRQSWSNTFCWIQDYLIFKRPFRNWPCSSDSEHKIDPPPPSPWWSVKVRRTDLDFRDRETESSFLMYLHISHPLVFYCSLFPIFWDWIDCYLLVCV